jgi:UTP--glucose-1-phosphate uridylyltransferase
MNRAVRKAVVPMAGNGTRFYPITHVVPKEFLPIMNRPLFHYIVDEVTAAGCNELICVIAPGRDLATPYVAAAGLDIKMTMVHQTEALGLGHAVGCAEKAVGDEPFFVLLPDVVIDAPTSVCAQMQAAYEGCATGGIIATRPEPREKLCHYGVVALGDSSNNTSVITDLVEKPAPESAPSNQTIVGRYLLPSSTFTYLREVQPGANGEIQLTDALRLIAKNEGLHALAYDETAMFDAGQPAGWLAANQYFAKQQGLL